MDLYQLAESFCPGSSSFLKDLQANLDQTSSSSTLAPGQVLVNLLQDSYSVKVGVTGFKPDELKVVVDDGYLVVSGHHKEDSRDGSKYINNEFRQKVKVPDVVDIHKIKSSMSQNGSTLSIVAPFKPTYAKGPDSGFEIPVEVKG